MMGIRGNVSQFKIGRLFRDISIFHNSQIIFYSTLLVLYRLSNGIFYGLQIFTIFRICLSDYLNFWCSIIPGVNFFKEFKKIGPAATSTKGYIPLEIHVNDVDAFLRNASEETNLSLKQPEAGLAKTILLRRA